MLVYSDADDWFEELPQEEKKDWVAIELSFRKRWLKEEVISIKETVTIENKPQVGLCKARPEAMSQAKPGPNRPGQAGPC